MLALSRSSARPFSGPSQASRASRSVVVRCAASSSSSSNSGSSYGRRLILGAGLATTALISLPDAGRAAQGPRIGEFVRTEEEWQKVLSPDAYKVLRQAATERRWSSAFNTEKRAGTFVCAGCGAPLYDSKAKYESGTGWPSFYQALPNAVDEVPDNSIAWMPRTEVRCKRCKGHLGHVFDDGPRPTGLRYCMNGIAMDFKPAEGA